MEESGRSKTLLLTVSVGNSDEEVLRWISEQTGLGTPTPRRDKKPCHRDVFIWRCFGHAATTLLQQLWPFLEVKKPIVELVLKAWEAIQAEPQLRYSIKWRSALLARSKELNRRGPEGAKLRARIKVLRPELRGTLISRCTADRPPYVPANVLGILDKLNCQAHAKPIETRPGWRGCVVCRTEFRSKQLPTPSHPQLTCSRSRECALKYRGRTTTPCLTIDPDLANGLALLMDAEGCIRVRHSYGSVVAEVHFGNTDRDVVELVRAATGLGGVHQRRPRKKTHAPSFHATFRAQGAYGFLEQIWPFLRIKRRQAELAMYVQERRLHAPSRYGDRSWQDEAVRLSAALNAKGKRSAVPPTKLDGGLIVI